jgi:cyclopropane fatty-acyl-phospholipid synthase-like methyltransferase
MSDKSFAFYEAITKVTSNVTELSGRYSIQAEAEREIALDVARKLEVRGSDRLLEIGCGVGNILLPLSFMAASATGVDNPEVLKILAERCPRQNITLVPGAFPDVELRETFDKIVVYGVLLYMPDEATLHAFVDAALARLAPSGRMLLGDITTAGRKQRFLQSKQGQAFSLEWQKKMETASRVDVRVAPEKYLTFSDEVVLRLMLRIREAGWHSYLLPQSPGLPFGNTREDILVLGPEAVQR